MKLAVIGAGWAGLSCAVEAVSAGHEVTVFEASRSLGGRARRIDLEDAGPPLDNGQHILIGAYRETLAMMRRVGVDPDAALLRLPLSLRFADGGGIALPRWPEPLHLLGGIATAGGWSAGEKWALVRTALRWRIAGFRCSRLATVGELCAGLPPRVMRELIEPLCVSALNTPVEESSGQVFLRVLSDALFGAAGGADLLLPRVDLGRLFPDAAWRWLESNSARLHPGQRIRELVADSAGGWEVDGVAFDRVVLAVGSTDAAKLVRGAIGNGAISTRGAVSAAEAWSSAAEALRFESIATVYLSGATALAAPMLALRASQDAPAQFAFDREQLCGATGSLALVVSACDQDRDLIQQKVLTQARSELHQPNLAIARTIVEKRATFACTAGLVRPSMHIAAGLSACGDYVDGPYPATLEGAVRNGLAAAGMKVQD
ncbi:hydroxysqualene dehydroxylase HpnE [Variovorax sp. RHLX14]|uniref:hydroxysqualene dehydroxylase HpnE n=1 Tax=Variovorax sp. RHLX14 TaxID=1259731 RepID=UPI003F46C7D3